jgi:hypothetical protein
MPDSHLWGFGNGKLRAGELSREIVAETVSCTGDSITDNKMGIGGQGILFREEIVSHLGTHSSEAYEAGALRA